MSKTKLEQFYEDELGKLLLHSIHAHNGKLEDLLYQILNEGEALSDPFGEEAASHQGFVPMPSCIPQEQLGQYIPELPEKQAMSGSDIMKLQKVPIRFPETNHDRILDAISNYIGYQPDLPNPPITIPPLKEYVFRIPERGVEVRITFSKENQKC